MKKYVRPALITLSLSFMAYNLMLNPDNPQSWVNRTMNRVGKVKYRLKVERLDDQIAQYKYVPSVYRHRSY